MTFSVLVDGDAQRDIEEIVAWLDVNAPDQSDRFLGDLDAALASIADHAMLRPEVLQGARRESLRIFSYHLWYLVLPEIEHAEVFAVLHHRRGPDALASRLCASRASAPA